MSNLKPPPMYPHHVWAMTLREREQMIMWIKSHYVTANVPWRFRHHIVTIDAEYTIVKYMQGRTARLTPDEKYTTKG
jgi:hypothetical protein